MVREEESRHKSKRHKRDHEREEDKGHLERDRKKSRDGRSHKDSTVSKEGTNARSLGADATDPARSPLQNGRGAGESREDANGEVSMSIEETNRVRISLGLKPLQTENTADKERAAHAAAIAVKAEERKKADEAAMAEHIRERREHRREQEKLKKVKTLGEAGKDVDDLAAWVERSKKAEKKAKDLEMRKRLEKQLAEQDEESEEEELANGTELGGMKVKHDANELNEGETMILTLADRRILDDKGLLVEDPEELENVLVTEDKLRRRAFKAAAKENKPLFGEDGRVQGLLEKYDEEGEDEGMLINGEGAVEEAKRKRQADIRERLRAAESAATDNKPSFQSKGDTYTSEEMARFSKPKSQKKRKIRKKAAEPEEDTLDIAALEAEAAAAEAGKDRGSRADRASKDAKLAEEREAKLQEKKDRYDNALKKANIATMALQQQQTAEEDVDEGDEDLQASLDRARRAAMMQNIKKESSKQDREDLAVQVARRRQEQERRQQEEGGGLEFSEAKDFADSIQMIQVKEEAEEPQDTQMHEEEKPVAPTPVPEELPPPASQNAQPSADGWVEAGKAKEEVDEEMPDAAEVKEEQQDSMVRERTVGQGIGAAMELLRQRGELQQGPEWAGRTNDLKGHAMEGLSDVYQNGNHEDRLSNSIEQALTQRDEFGRIMTPKERFRDLCHNFHGKDISKGKQEKRQRKHVQEIEARRAATGEGSSQSFSRIGGQQVAGTPYVVLSGNLQPGQSSDPASGFQTVERRLAPTPILGGATPIIGGGDTPLVGARKVEVMLGLKKEPDDKDMPPPAPRNFRKRQ